MFKTRIQIRAAWAATLALLGAAAVVLGCADNPEGNAETKRLPLPPEAPVALVNGEPIELQEFERQLDIEQRAVRQYYDLHYKIENGPDFWSASYDGQNPLALAKTNALRVLVRRKVQQIEMKKHGLLSDISYESFMRRWNAENARRTTAAATGERIYGPTQYKQDDYFEYEFSNALPRFKEWLSTNTLRPRPDELEREYVATKDKFFRQGASTRAKLIYFGYAPDGTSDAKAKARELASAAQEQLNRGARVEEISTNSSLAERTLEMRNHRRWNADLIADEAFSLAPKQTSNPIDTGDAYVLIHCLVVDVSYVPFESAKARMAFLYVESRYEKYIETLIERADVQTLRNTYNQVTHSASGGE